MDLEVPYDGSGTFPVEDSLYLCWDFHDSPMDSMIFPWISCFSWISHRIWDILLFLVISHCTRGMSERIKVLSANVSLSTLSGSSCCFSVLAVRVLILSGVCQESRDSRDFHTFLGISSLFHDFPRF